MRDIERELPNDPALRSGDVRARVEAEVEREVNKQLNKL